MNSEKNWTLLDFTYDDKYNISDILYDEALNVTFLGLTVSYRLTTVIKHICICNNVVKCVATVVTVESLGR